VSPTKFEEIPGSEGIYKIDFAFLAMGFLYTEPKGLLEGLGVAKDERGNIKTSPDYQTNVPGVFAAGDARRGQSLIVWAISEGRECAKAIDESLMNISRLESKNNTIFDSLQKKIPSKG
jgi:glutamate synthase (NADPH/NADH) small chain